MKVAQALAIERVVIEEGVGESQIQVFFAQHVTPLREEGSQGVGGFDERAQVRIVIELESPRRGTEGENGKILAQLAVQRLQRRIGAADEMRLMAVGR